MSQLCAQLKLLILIGLGMLYLNLKVFSKEWGTVQQTRKSWEGQESRIRMSSLHLTHCKKPLGYSHLILRSKFRSWRTKTKDYPKPATFSFPA